MREGFFFCICPDSEIIKDFIENKISSLKGTWRKKTLWGDEEISSEFLKTFQGSSLLGENIYLIVRRAELVPKNFWDNLSPLLRRFKEDVFPFFCIETEWEKGKPKIPSELSKKKYYLVAQKRKWIFLHEGASPPFISQYVRQWAREQGLSISAQTIHYLIEILPPYLGGVKSELEKLKLHLGEKKRVELSDLEIISPFLKKNAFEIINTLQTPSPSSTKKLLSIITQGNYTSHEEILPLLHLLFREARNLWKIYSGEKVHLPRWVIEKKVPVAQRIGKKGLQRIWNILIQAEISLKSSPTPPAEVFYHMIMELHRVFWSGRAKKST